VEAAVERMMSLQIWERPVLASEVLEQDEKQAEAM
jgi:hypothetical protein